MTIDRKSFKKDYWFGSTNIDRMIKSPSLEIITTIYEKRSSRLVYVIMETQ